MSNLSALLVFANLSAPSPPAPADWELWLHVASGWGGHSAIYLDAQGRIRVYGGSQVRELVMDTKRGSPSSFCEGLALTPTEMRDYESQIVSIPADILEDGGLHIHGTCADEPQYGLSVFLRGQSYNFGYSQLSFCNDQEVPGWLSKLVDGLWERLQAISECKTAPPDAEPSQ